MPKRMTEQAKDLAKYEQLTLSAKDWAMMSVYDNDDANPKKEPKLIGWIFTRKPKISAIL